ncbi:hypothetical protein NQ317_011410 [Molorchus minor]|uniref:Zinc finger ZPR1-type domain-containing protein n=1 Tax=Molorchus minor TaxID=1323400 RepID=A0ABQ9JPG5_9CUCU|nr:hypothetical protein NQ317_011410 [Molorchus minor]
MGESKPIFRDISADDPEPEATEIESLCMNCQKTGVTRLLLTKIPFYREVVLMSFSCEHCGHENNEIQSGASVASKGIIYTLNVITDRDLNRQVVKSDYTSIKIPEVDFEIPAKSQKGGKCSSYLKYVLVKITTVEGIINRAITGLEQDQIARRADHPEAALQIDEFIKKLKQLKELEKPFTVILEDISGNSFVENLNAPKVDENYKTHIPHFKEVVIMATVCDVCGNKTNEVKSGSGIETKGVRIEVDIREKEDFSRDLLKVAIDELFAAIYYFGRKHVLLKIPQLDMEVGPHALGGRFTTVEGLIVAVKDQLMDPHYAYVFRDSAEPKSKHQFEMFIKKLDDVLEGKLHVTIVLDDPAGNSYIQSMRDDDQSDQRLRITHYERSFEQNEELGLNDMKTENYETS